MYAGEMHENLHHRPTPHASVIMPDVEWLAVTCWCESNYVCVLQRDVRWGCRTYSCGRPKCHAPDGLVQQALYVADNAMLPRRLSRRSLHLRPGTPVHEVPRKSPTYARGARWDRIAVAVRREKVEALWRRGKNAAYITRVTGYEYHNVAADIHRLRVAQRRAG